MKVTIKKASFHRNGVCGLGFWAIVFEDADEGTMLASLFEDQGVCAVYKLSELAKENIDFANGNSWRGDVYEAELRPKLLKYLKKHGSNKLGPFSL